MLAVRKAARGIPVAQRGQLGMASTILNPNANGNSQAGWTNVGGSYSAILSDAGDATYAERDTTAGNSHVRVNLDDLSGSAGRIVKVVGSIRISEADGANTTNMSFFYEQSGTNQTGGSAAPTLSPATHSETKALDVNGTVWTREKINDLEFGCTCFPPSAGSSLYLHKVYVTVTWEGSSGFAYLVGSLAGLMGSSIQLLDAARMAATMRNTVVGQDEVDIILNTARNWKFRKYLFLPECVAA